MANAIDWNEVENLIRTEGDAEALRAKLLEMIAPKEPPLVLEDGKTLTLNNLIDRLQRHVCGGSVPALYMLPVHVRNCSRDSVTVTIFFNRSR